MAKVREGREQEQVGAMFDRISFRYDLANRVLSFGIDQLWRNRAIRSLGSLSGKTLLDVASGTGDMLEIAHRQSRGTAQLIALDYARNMMVYGRKRHQTLPVVWLHGSADTLPFPDQTVDAVTITFGIRNVAAYETALREFHRVLKPGGKLAILEFSMPENILWRTLYGFYFNRILPIVGGGLSGNFDAYRYLPASVQKFPYGAAFNKLLYNAGFSSIHSETLTGGIATLYTADVK
ncbi:MAG: bifunctional demethylmenaquinone methyltransferase/2-methoxy-6-polyprenyl-1,4-benzoquinol methylase UbiE [bacterium]|nr:bifunctional demethylmenaquinone methyltransferase/2-methoxy-6-polyprenyl-1,4-benzoquinol methylase UbiE [bacterium]